MQIWILVVRSKDYERVYKEPKRRGERLGIFGKLEPYSHSTYHAPQTKKLKHPVRRTSQTFRHHTIEINIQMSGLIPCLWLWLVIPPRSSMKYSFDTSTIFFVGTNFELPFTIVMHHLRLRTRQNWALVTNLGLFVAVMHLIRTNAKEKQIVVW